MYHHSNLDNKSTCTCHNVRTDFGWARVETAVSNYIDVYLISYKFIGCLCDADLNQFVCSSLNIILL